jgi:hypothetical protein
MSSDPWCLNCRYRAEGGFCEHRPTARPHTHESCIFSPSKFERKEEPKGGKLISFQQEAEPRQKAA